MGNSVNNFFLFSFIVVVMVALSSALDPDMASKSAPFMAPQAAAPGVDCMSLIYDMIDCISYINVGSKDLKPDQECCSGLKTVLKTNAECVCEALKSSSQLGFSIDMKRAVALPSACNAKAPSLDNCRISNAPGTSPVVAPANSPQTGPAPSSQKTPAPAPHAVLESQKSPAPAPHASVVSPKSSIAVPPISSTPAFITVHNAPAPSPKAGAYSLVISPAVHFCMFVASFFYLLA